MIPSEIFFPKYITKNDIQLITLWSNAEIKLYDAMTY